MSKIEPGKAEILVPHVAPIVDIHRGPDGYVCFARKVDDEGWENLPAIEVGDLSSIFPEFAEELLRDSYFSINTFWKPKREKATYLNACWADIDLHAPGEMRTMGQRYGAIIDMVHAGQLLEPSMTVYSGRGMWLLWLLVNKQGSFAPPGAFPEKILYQEAINRELARRLGSDSIPDAARMIRVPGSTNTKADPGNEVVRFEVRLCLDKQRHGPQYTLQDLGTFLGVEPPALRDSRRKAVRSEESQRALVGYKALYAQQFDHFRRLWALRGGFHEGCRHRAAYHYSIIMERYGMDEEAAWNELLRMGAACHPPLNVQELNQAFHQGKKRQWPIRDADIARHLLVTPEEGRRIPEWAPETNQKKVEAIDMNMTNTARIALRKQAIAEIVADLGYKPSSRAMAKILGERGMLISHTQVATYYKQGAAGAPLGDARKAPSSPSVLLA